MDDQGLKRMDRAVSMLREWISDRPEALLALAGAVIVVGMLGIMAYGGVRLAMGDEDETYPPVVVQRFERGDERCVRYTEGEYVHFTFEGGLRAQVRYTVCEPDPATVDDPASVPGCYEAARVGQNLPRQCDQLAVESGE